MKNKTLIRNLMVLAVVALVIALTAPGYLWQQKDDVLYTENPNLTSVLRLSDYNENLKGTNGDVDIYVFDSGVPGGKALIYGGTHTNEIAPMMSAVTYLENVKCEAGTLYVIVRANNSGYTHTQPLLAQQSKMTFELADGTVREFRNGTRIASPLDSWPDPNYHANSSKRDLKHEEIAELRNLNRVHPGMEEGYLIEMVSYGIRNFINTEEIDFIYDGHEAGAESTSLVNTLVVHERATALGSAAVMNCVINGYPLMMEFSGQTSYGLSHRGLGDSTNALCTLFETSNPAMGSYHDKVTEALYKDGVSANYTALFAAGMFTKPYEFTSAGWPIEKRTAYHMAMSESLISTFNDMNPDKPLKISGMPDAAEMIEKGLEYTLKSLA